MDWNFMNKTWDKWASSNVGSEGRNLSKLGHLFSSLPSLFTHKQSDWFNYIISSAKQEGIKADPMELSHFISFVKRSKLQTETFFIGQNQYIVTSIHESWFAARCMNTLKPAGEGAIVMQTAAFLLIGLYEGSIGAASRAMAPVDQFALQLGRRHL